MAFGRLGHEPVDALEILEGGELDDELASTRAHGHTHPRIEVVRQELLQFEQPGRAQGLTGGGRGRGGRRARRAAGPVRVEGPAPSAPATVTPRQPLRPPGLLELEELLSDYLDTRVSVTMGTGRGKLVVEFATLEDLERIYRLVTEAPERH